MVSPLEVGLKHDGRVHFKARNDKKPSPFEAYPKYNGHVRFKERIEAKMESNVRDAGSLIEIKDPEGRLKQFGEHMLKEKAAGLVVANHDQHVNIMAFIKALGVVNEATDNKLSHHLIVASSLLNGDQGVGFQRFALSLIPSLEKQNMKMIGIMRDKDRKEYYGFGKKSMEELNKDDKLSKRNIYSIAQGFRRGKIVWFFPAGTTIEGVIEDPETQRVHGLDKIDNGSLAMFMAIAKKYEKDLRVLPLTLNGHNNIVPAREEHATFRAKYAILRNGAVGRFIGDKQLAEVIPGEMFGLEDLQSESVAVEDVDGVNNFTMKRIAKRMPKQRQGVFA